MLFTIFKIDMKGKNDVIIKRNNEIIFKKDKIGLMEEINIPNNKCDNLVIEITYTSPILNTSHKRKKFFLKLLIYHLIPLKKDALTYSYKARHCSKKTIIIDGTLTKDCTLDYIPYQESRLTYDDDGSYVRYHENIEYPYQYISYCAKIINILIVLLLVLGLFYVNYLWIKTL